MYMCKGQKIADQLAWLVRRRRRRTFIETKYIRRETLAKVYKNRSREGHPAISICIIIIMYRPYVNIFVTYRYPAVTIRRPHVGPGS